MAPTGVDRTVACIRYSRLQVAPMPRAAIGQPTLKAAWINGNVSLRIPTPLFGLGLIEAISDSTIAANTLERMKAMALKPSAHDPQRPGAMRAGDRVKMYERLGIIGRPGRGRENRSGNDSTITRFGWKAQNKSLLLFAGEAYNVEQGVTNELFPNERDEEATPLPEACKRNATPEDDIDFEQLDQPAPATAARPASSLRRSRASGRSSCSCACSRRRCPPAI